MTVICPETKKPLEDSRVVLWCAACEQEVEDPGIKRECSRDSCGEEFLVQEGDERNCPSCNNPFTRLVEEDVCPDCEEQAQETEVADCDDCDAVHSVEDVPQPTPEVKPDVQA